MEIEFIRNVSEPCVYTKTTDHGIMLLLVYVDDILITGGDTVGIQVTCLKLGECFEIRNLETPTSFLKVQILRNADSIFLHHTTYLNKFLNECKITNSGSVATPLPQNIENMRIQPNTLRAALRLSSFHATHIQIVDQPTNYVL